jgi:flavin-dependent dehydrogenase
MGGILPIEGEKWKVIMYSIGKDLPSTNETEFLEFARTLRNSKVYDMIKNAEPESAIYGYRAKGSRLVHYEKFRSWPENFIIIGDAVCTFNPFYGQGMTVAAIGGQLLDEFLKKNFNRMQLNCANFALRFQKELYKKNLYPGYLLPEKTFVGLPPRVQSQMYSSD